MLSAASPAKITVSREQAIAAIKEACEQMAQSKQLGSIGESEKGSKNLFANRIPRFPRKSPRVVQRSLIGLFSLVCIGAVVLVWANFGRAAPELPIVTASVTKKEDRPATAMSDKLETATVAQATPTGSEPPAAPKNSPATPVVAPISSELNRQMGDIVRDLASVKQGLDQLKAEQSRIGQENAELSEQLKAMREMARHNVELTENLTAMQTQTAREIGILTDQLKANQDLITSGMRQLKDSQEQVRLASEQKQRSVRKPVPKLAVAPAAVQPRAPANLQPRQQ